MNNVNVLLHALQDSPCVLCATSIFTLFIIVTKLRAERTGVRMPVGAGDFLISEQSPDRLWGHPAYTSVFNGDLSRG
jgi:hypothetical protein